MTATTLLWLEKAACQGPEGAVFADVDFALRAGERVALVGGNGAGKSSLLQLLVGLKAPTAGRVIAFDSERSTESDFREVRRRVGLLFQDADDQLFCPTVLDDVAFGPLNLGYGVREARTHAESTLASLGLAWLADRVTHHLSGGEKRLVALASVLAMEPEVLLLDEPTNDLDDAAYKRLTEHLLALPQAMLLATHDQALIGRLAERAVVLADGGLHEGTIHQHPHVHHHAHPHVHIADAGDGDHHPGLGRQLIHHGHVGGFKAG